MAPRPSRSEELTAYLSRLTQWATRSVRILWAQMDPGDIRGSWATIAQPLLAIHERLCVAALDATDVHMTLLAADNGLAWWATWPEDFPDRAMQTPQGANAPAQIMATPAICLWRIGQGEDAARALEVGLNILLRLYGTQAAHIARQVTRERAVADMRANL